MGITGRKLRYKGQTPEERQTDQTCHTILLLSFSNKIVLTRRNLSLFEQGTLCLQLAHNCDNENTENRQCAYNHIQPVSVKRGEFVTRDTEKRPLSVLTSVRIKRVNLRENL